MKIKQIRINNLFIIILIIYNIFFYSFKILGAETCVDVFNRLSSQNDLNIKSPFDPSSKKDRIHFKNFKKLKGGKAFYKDAYKRLGFNLDALEWSIKDRIIEHIGQGNRTHVIRTESEKVYKIVAESADGYYLTLEWEVQRDLEYHFKKYGIRTAPILTKNNFGVYLEKELIDRDFIAANMIKDNSELTPKQKKALEKMWHAVRKYHKDTGIGLDFKASNIYWDSKIEDWVLFDCGPRTSYKIDKYTFKVKTFKEYLDVWLPKLGVNLVENSGVDLDKISLGEESVVVELYSKSRKLVAPAITYFSDEILKLASKNKKPQIIFLARDGVGAFIISSKLIERFPHRYPNLNKKNLHYMYINKDTIDSKYMVQYLKQEGINEINEVIIADLGFYGTLNQKFQKLISKDIGAKYLGLYLTFSEAESSSVFGVLHDYEKGIVYKGADNFFKVIPGNYAIHFLEDTFSGQKRKPKNLLINKDMEILPDIPINNYSDINRAKRHAALEGFRDFISRISEKELNNFNPEKILVNLLEFLSNKKLVKRLMVPHEKH